MSGQTLDMYDIRLLEALQDDDARPLHELAEKVRLSVSQCSRRIHRLKESGCIRRQVTLLDPSAIGLDVEAFISVSLNQHSPEQTKIFHEQIKNMLPVIECYAITGGDGDYLLKVVAPNQKALSTFLMEELMTIPNICNIKTSLTLSAVKSTTALPLDL